MYLDTKGVLIYIFLRTKDVLIGGDINCRFITI